MSICDVYLTPLFSGFYQLNVDATGPIDGVSAVLVLWREIMKMLSLLLVLGSIIGDCISCNGSGSFCTLTFLYVRLEVNQAAHYLDKYALHNLDGISIEETQPCIYAVLTFDLLSDFC